MMITLSSYPLILIFVVSTLALFVAIEVGAWLGFRTPSEADVSPIEASVLGLLALMLGFTFSMGLARFEERRQGVLNEANAIGTAALRASLLPSPHGAQSLDLFREYVQIRADLATRLLPPEKLAPEIARSNALQKALWTQAVAALAKDDSMTRGGLYIQALNEMFDDQEKRLTAARAHVPDSVLLSLYGIAAFAFGFTAYAGGIRRRHRRGPVYFAAALVSAVILLIQDIERPSAGFVAISQQPMIDAAHAISDLLPASGGKTGPRLPEPIAPSPGARPTR